MSMDSAGPPANENDMLARIQAAQNPDGGWPYRQGGSWTEPTVYALLAHLASRTPVRRLRGTVGWLTAIQRNDGGWSPRQSVEQSTWVTALVALLPPETIGAERHAHAIEWLLGHTGMQATFAYRIRELVRNGKLPEAREQSGWPWFPGTSAWVTPTSLAILALQKRYRNQPSEALSRRIEIAQSYLLAHRCADGGWNYGSERALGYNSDSYPETTGQALLALHGTDPAVLAPSFALAKRFAGEVRQASGAAWLRLGLLAHGQLPAEPPAPAKPCRTLLDAALQFLASRVEPGHNIFLD